MAKLARLTVNGFKSIRTLENFEFRNLNVLIGANGAGKSNFISLFRMLAEIQEKRLQLYVQDQDGPDGLLFGGRKRTRRLDAEFYFERNGYLISLVPSGDRLVFAREDTYFQGDYVRDSVRSYGSGHVESKLAEAEGDSFAAYVRPALAAWRVYHFHDTSASAPVRQRQAVRDNLRLKADAANLAPFLLLLRQSHEPHYRRIVDTIRMAAPFFGDFLHRSEPAERIELEWLEVEDPDTPRSPRQLSDGTLRFICLCTLLLQPEKFRPSTILLDEPELGLHPYALTLLAEMLKEASTDSQLIVSTQSAELLSGLRAEDVVVVGRDEGSSTFRRLESERLKEWLEDYALGELWKMNILGGRPVG